MDTDPYTADEHALIADGFDYLAAHWPECAETCLRIAAKARAQLEANPLGAPPRA